MTPQDRTEQGERIARSRRRLGLSQAVVAGLIGRSESWLSQAERGLRGIDSHTVLERLAEVLHIGVEDITGTAQLAGVTQRYHAASAIEQAMLSYQAPAGAVIRDRQVLAQAAAAYRRYQATHYDAAGRMLPGLILAAEQAHGDGRPESLRVRAAVYDLTAAVLLRTGNAALAWAAADRAMTAAAYAGEPLLAWMAAWRMSYVIGSRGHPRAALELAATAIGAGPPDTGEREHLSMYGALHLAAATAASACADRAYARSLLETARTVAEMTGETNDLGTAFGPSNVELHAIAVSMRLGDPREAARIGESISLSALPPGLTGRRTQVHLELAWAYAATSYDAAAVTMLLRAEKLSPQLVRYDQRTAGLLAELLRREHQPSTPQLRPLARRAGVI